MSRDDEIEAMRWRHVREARERKEAASAVEDALVASRMIGSASAPLVPPITKSRIGQEPGWKDPDPPFIDERGVPTIRSQVDQVLYIGAGRKPGCIHKTWLAEGLFKRCKRCKLLVPLKAADQNGGLKALLPILKDHVLVPQNEQGFYREEVVINDHLWITKAWSVRSIDRMQWHSFHLSVEFPRGWMPTACFSEMQFDRIITDVQPLLKRRSEYDPVAVYRACQMAIYGRCWENIPTLRRLL